MIFEKKSVQTATPQTDELSCLKDKVREAYAKLDYTTEPLLIDSCIYEINAASLRYEFYLNLVKSKV